jgi:hypothetical protein
MSIIVDKRNASLHETSIQLHDCGFISSAKAPGFKRGSGLPSNPRLRKNRDRWSRGRMRRIEYAGSISRGTHAYLDKAYALFGLDVRLLMIP